MRSIHITKQDKEFMKLRDQVLKIIPIVREGDEKGKIEMRKKWKAFRIYMGSYYRKVVK